MKRHLKRLRVPKFWKVSKKEKKWIVRPKPGPHKLFESIPLQVILRDILKIAETGKEAKSNIRRGQILVDGKTRRDQKYPVGLMDVVSIPILNQHYRIVSTPKGLELIKISNEEAKQKLFRINNKTVTRKGKSQLNLHDGKNILVEKNGYKTGDSLLLELPSLKILQHLKLEKGNTALITKGKNAGSIAKIKQLVAKKTKSPTKILCEIENEDIEVDKKYIFVVGKEKPLIKLSD